jgi:hypothetical protein
MGMLEVFERMTATLRLGTAALALIAAGMPAAAQSLPQFRFALEPAAPSAGVTQPTYNFYGVTGLIDMPSGEMQRDGELAASITGFGPFLRTTLTYQILPWMQGSFRYTGTRGLTIGRFGPADTYYDRSFDLRVRLMREGRWQPSVVVGLQDFIGTGTFAAEYLVATKHLTPRIKVTGGVGWGRLGTVDPIFSFGTRPAPATPTGGTVNFNWFRGPAALFGGIEWQPTDRLGLKVEYSSDDYSFEETNGAPFGRRSQLNFGAEYAVTTGIRAGLYYLYGSRIGFNVSVALNTRERAGGDTLVSQPAAPVALRPSRSASPSAWSESWAADPGAAANLRGPLVEAMRGEGLVLEALAVSAGRAELRLRNLRYEAAPQAIGRAARAMARVLPASVEVFDIVLVERGIPTSRVTLRRSDLEALEFSPDAGAALRARAEIADAAPLPEGAVRGEGLYPRLSWSISPYLNTALFDPDNPYLADLSLRLRGQVDLAPGLVLSGSVTKRIIGNLDQSTRASDSVLPRVRSETNIYNRADPVLERLTLAYYTRPGPNLYARLTAGYLERQFGGVSAELLWKPVNSRLALGAEVNYAVQRDFTGLGFRNYSVVTGHVSAYYALPQNFHAQLDVGRYLAGDWGATLSIDREFANGWRVGAFATLTDVPFATFGEGSFDKGIRLVVPLSAVAGRPSRITATAVLRPTLRDGGARLDVGGRLYETVRGNHAPALDASWGRVWR